MESTQLVIVLRRGHFPLVIEILKTSDGSLADAARREVDRLAKEMPEARIYAAGVHSTVVPSWEAQALEQVERDRMSLNAMLGLSSLNEDADAMYIGASHVDEAPAFKGEGNPT